MSGNNPKPYYVPTNAGPEILAVIEAHFDHETDMEEMQIEQEREAEKKQAAMESHARKLCVLRTLTFPVDAIFGTFFFGPEYLSKRTKLMNAMVKYIFKRISYREVIKNIEKYA